MKVLNLGLISYYNALKIMESLHHEVVQNNKHSGYLLVVEHPPTVTMGNRNNIQDLLLNPEGLKTKKIDYFKIDRGGSVTVHEPGQCVIYPIFNIFLHKRTVRSYVNLLEESMIETCKLYKIKAHCDPKNPGIWVGNNKVGAVGIRILNKVTKHGIAFNINNNLQTFKHIIPCGITTKGITTLFQEIKNQPLEQSTLQFDDVVTTLSAYVLKNLTH